MEAILHICDINLQDVIGEESYQEFISQSGVQWQAYCRRILSGDMDYDNLEYY